MKFNVEPTTSQSSFMLTATPDEYSDGCPPVDSLIIDTVVHNLSPANQAVAGAIVFDEYIGLEVSLDKEMPRMVERALGTYFGDRSVSASPITDVPRRVWPSAGTLYVSDFDRFLTPPPTPPGFPHDYYLQVADGAIFNGTFSSAHQLILASNAHMMSGLQNGAFSKAALYIAIGVLLSQDLHIRNIHLSVKENKEQLERYRQLLRSIELNLTWDSQVDSEAS